MTSVVRASCELGVDRWIEALPEELDDVQRYTADGRNHQHLPDEVPRQEKLRICKHTTKREYKQPGKTTLEYI